MNQMTLPHDISYMIDGSKLFRSKKFVCSCGHEANEKTWTKIFKLVVEHLANNRHSETNTDQETQ